MSRLSLNDLSTSYSSFNEIEKTMTVRNENRIPLWWMGGAAAAGACCFTQCLDTMKVLMQTQQDGNQTIWRITKNVIKEEGIMALNQGLSAAVLRQLTYSTFRFAFYEEVKQHWIKNDQEFTFLNKVIVAAIGGTIGGYVGTPADVVNVRMQNDIKFPKEQRRNYKHVFDGLRQIYKHEGLKGLFAGASMATGRSVLMTIGQLCFYDHCKLMLMTYVGMKDSVETHFTASIFAGAVATSLTQPLDVLKTRLMNARPGEFKNMWHVILYTAKLGPRGFFKGYILRFIRLAPHTILTFVFFEQLRIHLGAVNSRL